MTPLFHRHGLTQVLSTAALFAQNASHLALVRGYLERGEYARAVQECEQVLSFDNLPPDLRQQAEIYAEAARNYRRSVARQGQPVDRRARRGELPATAGASGRPMFQRLQRDRGLGDAAQGILRKRGGCR
jgi:hypothetical protein